MVTGTTNMVQQGSATVPASSSTDGAASPRRASDNRRSNKPIMEKRRRARINNCLNELKTLILDAMKKDPARHSKLEKADILEMTVKHLQSLQRQQAVISTATDPSVMGKFRAGFSECASEVGRFPGLEPVVKRRLLQHLANCLNQGREQQQEVAQVQVQILPKPVEVETAPQPLPQHNGILLSNSSGTSVHLVPTRLPNGDIALVLPTGTATSASPLPLLVPIPTRTPSNASASSSGSSCASAVSPEPMEIGTVQYNSPPMQKPLSLVVKKCREPVDEEKPWRPW